MPKIQDLPQTLTQILFAANYMQFMLSQFCAFAYATVFIKCHFIYSSRLNYHFSLKLPDHAYLIAFVLISSTHIFFALGLR